MLNIRKYPEVSGGFRRISAMPSGYVRILPEDRSDHVLSTIAQNGSVTSVEVASMLGLDARSARRLLGQMIADELVEKRGAASSTHYVIKEK
jgi:predicted HTH transcriptional regulator